MINNCPYCNELISVKETKCPYCGNILDEKTAKKKHVKKEWAKASMIIGSLVVIFLVFAYYGANESEKSYNTNSRLTNNDFFDNEVYSNVSAEIVKFGYLYGKVIEGNGIIYNRSDYDLGEYLKVKITYYNKSGDVVNTDFSYVGDGKIPKQSQKQFRWTTTVCDDCKKANIEIDKESLKIE